MHVTGVVLAAGSSRRLGCDKRTLRLDTGETLLQHSVARLLEVVDDVVVVLRSTDSALAASLPTRSLQVCMNSQPQRGMGFSLRQGIAASADADGWLVLPVDLPFLRVETIARARSVLRPGRAVVPVCHGRRGHPVALSAYFAPQLLGLDGDAGARRLLDREHDRVHWMNVHDPGIYRDIDQPQDLLSLRPT